MALAVVCHSVLIGRGGWDPIDQLTVVRGGGSAVHAVAVVRWRIRMRQRPWPRDRRVDGDGDPAAMLTACRSKALGCAMSWT